MVSFDFERIKEKALATAGRVADKSVEFAKVAGDKAKVAGKITKLKTEIAMEKDTLRKTYAEVGKLYHEKYKHAPAPEMAQAISEINLALEKVAQKEKEVAALKYELTDSYEETVEAAKESVEDVVEQAKAAAEDMVEKAEDVVEEIKEDE